MKKLIILVFIVLLAFGIGIVSAQQPKQPKPNIVKPSEIGEIIEKDSPKDQDIVRRIGQFDAMAKATASSDNSKRLTTGSPSAVIVTDRPATFLSDHVAMMFLTIGEVRGETALVFYQIPPIGSTRTHQAYILSNGFGPGMGMMLQNGGFSSFESSGPMDYEVYILTEDTIERAATILPVFSEEGDQPLLITSVTEEPLGQDRYIMTAHGNFQLNSSPTIVLGCCYVIPASSVIRVTNTKEVRFKLNGFDTYFGGGLNLLTVSIDSQSKSLPFGHRRVY